jgi:hypothetical protein
MMSNISYALQSFAPAILVCVIVFIWFLIQRKAQENDIPPLDLIDAKKLDEMVSNQVDLALKPMLQSNGYTEEQINQVLTRTSLGRPQFRR